MIRYLLIGLFLVLGIYPVTYVRKNYITMNEIYGIFVGNYIYYALFFLMTVMLLVPVHYFVRQLTNKQINTIIFTVLVLVGVIGYYNYRSSDLIYDQIPIAKSAEMPKFRLVFISDLHLNSNSNKALFTDAVEKINSVKPDLIVVGGDLLQDSHRQVKDDYQEVFSKLRATYGKYLIMGNHEYYGNSVEENLAYIESLGFKVIRDQLLEIAGIQFLARDDLYSGQRAKLPALYEKLNIDLNKPIVILDHNPQSIPESIELKADLQLSGHTHGGQFFPISWLLDHKLDNAGGYKKFNQLHTIVSEGLGVGYWKIIGPWQMPYRLGTNSEINVVDLMFTKLDP